MAVNRRRHAGRAIRVPCSHDSLDEQHSDRSYTTDRTDPSREGAWFTTDTHYHEHAENAGNQFTVYITLREVEWTGQRSRPYAWVTVEPRPLASDGVFLCNAFGVRNVAGCNGLGMENGSPFPAWPPRVV